MSEQGILYRYLPQEQAPPEQVWERLEQLLDEGERAPFKQLSQLELEPPPFAWDNISNSLDEKAFSPEKISFAETVLGIEKNPPLNAWENIEQEITVGQDKKIKTAGSRVVRMVSIGLAMAACMSGIIILGVGHFRTPLQNTNQVAIGSNKSNPVLPLTDSVTNRPQVVAADHPNIVVEQKSNFDIAKANIPDNNVISSPKTDEDLNEYNAELEKRKTAATISNINTTNNSVASNERQIRDINGNIVDNITDHNTTASGGDYLSAVGPNGNSVRVSTKLANMIEFFQNDSTKNANEEYLDRVMRESNIWRKKLIDWKAKVDKADSNPSQMNFLDPIDLLLFLKENQ